MTEKTKKLITAGMLSDVFGIKVKKIIQGYGKHSEEICFVEDDETDGTWPCSTSAYELKDKLKEWLHKNKTDAYLVLRYAKDGCCAAVMEDDYFKITKTSKWCKDDTEALLKLYHAVKGE